MAIELSKELKDKIDLSKKEAATVIGNIGLSNQKSRVILALDISGSMSSLLNNGKVQRAIERILPLALNFDDDGSVEFFPFHHKAFQHNSSISLENIQDFVKKELLPKYSLGGTSYAPVINLIRESLGKDPSKTHAISGTKKGGLFGMFKKTVKEFGTENKNNPANQPAYVIFITDGVCSDRNESEDAILEASNEEIFWQFVGIGSASFGFLEKLDDLEGRYLDNADFFQINDLDSINDNELYTRLLNEFPEWIKLARNKNIIC